MSTNGLLSFRTPFDNFRLCGSLPCAATILIAPIWTDLDFRTAGFTFFRATQDPATLDSIANAIANVNPLLSDYRPRQAIVFTWFESRSHFDDVCMYLNHYNIEWSFSIATTIGKWKLVEGWPYFWSWVVLREHVWDLTKCSCWRGCLHFSDVQSNFRQRYFWDSDSFVRACNHNAVRLC